MKSNRWIFLAIVIVGTTFYAFLPVIFPPESSIVDDSLEYAAQAESVNPASWFHPHHLLNNITHRLLWLALGGENQPIRVIYLMRWTSHLSMGIALALIYLIALGMGSSRFRALLLVAFLLFSCSFWVFGSVAEVVAPSMAMFLAIVWGLFYLGAGKQPSPLKLAFWSLLYGLAITWNQIDSVYLPALWVGIWGYAQRTRLKSIAAFTLPALIWAAGSYLIVMLTVRSSTGANDVYAFATSYASWGVWGKGTLASLPTSWQHLLLVQSFSFLRWELIFNGPFAIGASLLTIVSFLVGIWGWISGRKSDRDWRMDWGWMAVLSLIAIGFINWWQADAWDFWVMPWALLMLGWVRIKRISDKLIVPILIAFTIAIGSFNLIRLVLPRHEESVNPYYSVLISTKEQGFSDCYELMTVNPHLWRYAFYWGRIEHAGLYADDGEGNFSAEIKNKINKRLMDYQAQAQDRPLLVDQPIHDLILREFVGMPSETLRMSFTNRKITSAAFEGIHLDIYEIAKQ